MHKIHKVPGLNPLFFFLSEKVHSSDCRTHGIFLPSPISGLHRGVPSLAHCHPFFFVVIRYFGRAITCVYGNSFYDRSWHFWRKSIQRFWSIGTPAAKPCQSRSQPEPVWDVSPTVGPSWVPLLSSFFPYVFPVPIYFSGASGIIAVPHRG